MTPLLDLDLAVPDAASLGPVHLVGIGGIGMSGIARILLARGVRVSGSDAKDVPVLAVLRALGADVRTGFDADRLHGVATLVASSAVRDDNVELVAARRLGLLVLHRSQALQALMRGRRGVAVAGTNGKTTTSSMLTVVLQHAGADPSFAIGGELAGAATNAAEGTGDIFVAEADESDSSFLVYTPELSVVTNVQPDHLDHYGTAEAVEAAFARFAARLPPRGTLVACADDPGSARLSAAVGAAAGGPVVVRYGRDEGADVRVVDVAPDGGRTALTLLDGGRRVGRAVLRVPGEHNTLNAAAAYAAATRLGVAPADALGGLEAFTGTRRRFEHRGDAAGVRVYDDYAHNPAKVAAAVATGRQVAGGGRLVVVFQPHLYSRTLDFAAQFGAALSGADEVVVMDVYAAREDPVPGVTGALVADAATVAVSAAGGGARVVFEPSWSAAAQRVVDRAAAGDLVLTVGAGDVTMLGGEVLALLADRAAAADGPGSEASGREVSGREVSGREVSGEGPS